MDPVGSILLLLRPWMGYDYIVIQVVCWVELLEQRRLYPNFVKIWIPINGCENMDLDKWDTIVVSGHPKSTGIPRVDRLSMGPPDLGCHTNGEIP